MKNRSKLPAAPSSDPVSRSSGRGTTHSVARLDRKVTRLAAWLCASQVIFGGGLTVAFIQRDRDQRERDHDLVQAQWEDCADDVATRLETREIFFAITEPYADSEVGRSIRRTIDELRPELDLADTCGERP